tara:strand:- start:10 stop:579 length:570 start_codon:yes stop_codon:yes gene_type:complete
MSDLSELVGGGGGGAMELISSVSMSGASTVDFTSLPLGTYDNFFILCTGVGNTVNSAALMARMFKNGSLVTGSDYLVGMTVRSGTSSLSYQSSSPNALNLSAEGIPTDTKGTLQLWLTNMNDAEARNFNGYSHYYQAKGTNPGSATLNEKATNLICGATGTGSFDGIRLYPEVSTFTSGQASLYGFKTS